MESTLLTNNANGDDHLNEILLNTDHIFTDNFDRPDESSDNISVIGENVTITDRDMSVDSTTTNMSSGTPQVNIGSPDAVSFTEINPPKVTDTLKSHEVFKKGNTRLPNLLKLSFSKNNEDNVFVKPSPVTEVMSPAKMLQFEVDLATSSTPTMKRAAIDFDFFNKNNFEEYFSDVPKRSNEKLTDDPKVGETFKETPVIVKANTVRHEIGYGK